MTPLQRLDATSVDRILHAPERSLDIEERRIRRARDRMHVTVLDGCSLVRDEQVDGVITVFAGGWDADTLFLRRRSLAPIAVIRAYHDAGVRWRLETERETRDGAKTWQEAYGWLKD